MKLYIKNEIKTKISIFFEGGGYNSREHTVLPNNIVTSRTSRLSSWSKIAGEVNMHFGPTESSTKKVG